jgi:hypothetical protein
VPEKKKTRIMKRAKLFRFTPETIRRLQIAADKAGMSETVYVELALKERLKKDGIGMTDVGSGVGAGNTNAGSVRGAGCGSGRPTGIIGVLSAGLAKVS